MVPQQQRRRRRRAALARTAERRLVVARGAGGFGFTIAGQRPCVVSAVATGGPADRAGLRAGDALMTVDGANVARAPHASVARLVAAAPGAISLSVTPRESPPTDTEDTEPDERARTRRRHPPPRRRPQMMHHPGCHAAPSTSGVNEILQNLSRAQLTPQQAARLECRTVLAYLGTIETPQAAASAAPAHVRNAVRKLRQERRSHAPVLLSVLPNALLLRRPTGQVLAQYQRERIVYAGCGSEADRRFLGLVTAAELAEAEASHSCHVFAVDPRMAEHEAHASRAREFQILCTMDPVAERCLEFPPSAEYVVAVIRGMYSLAADDSGSPGLQQISRLAVKGDSPAVGNFSRCNRVAFRGPRDRRLGQREDVRLEGQDCVANSPQPSNHSEITTTSSNSDSGIGFHNDCRNIADRILVVDFARRPPANAYVREPLRRPLGLVGCGFDADGSFLSNATPVVEGFSGQGRPLDVDDGLGANGCDYTGRGAVYDRVCSESEGHYYEFIPPLDVEVERVSEAFNSVEIFEELEPQWAADAASVRSSRSHEEARPRRRRLQASLDDMLVLGLRDPPHKDDDDHKFLHPAAVKCKVRKSKPLNILSKTRNMLSGRDRESRDSRDSRESRKSRESRESRAMAGRRAMSASAGDVCAEVAAEDGLPAAASEPDLRDTQSEQSSPFRRWTTGSGAGSSYRHHDHRNMYNKQMSEGSPAAAASGGVARWSLGLEQLLADPAGAAAFAHFLAKEFASENIRFWWLCEQYISTQEPGKRARLAEEIWRRHLADGAADAVNVDAAARRAVQLRRALQPPPADLFLQAQKHIFNVMKFDSYPRFLRSAEHAGCARADLCGRALPYGPDPAASPDGNHSAAKLKKSASNASERRRSGGPSLLPWKRAPSKDREERPPPTDVVKSSQSSGLCRVVLPDGATSVVGVGEGVSVGQLVERLLQRRNLPSLPYRVLLRDAAKDEPTTVELSRPSTSLGGREVIVECRAAAAADHRTAAGADHRTAAAAGEGRAVIRAELGGGQCVAIRCRGARPLRHVLRSVLPRYGAAGAHRALRDGVALELDTLAQELDGARIQIVEVCADSPDELTLIYDEDTQSTSVASGPSRNRYENGMNNINRVLREDDEDAAECGSVVCNGGGGGSCSSEGNSVGGNSTGGNRVRAALRSGPPLHHHPPDFLESLRETQRQRLQSKSEEVASVARIPPPLPPKPRAALV